MNTKIEAPAADSPVPAFEITLKHPFTSNAGVPIERLCLRRARRADVRAASQYSRDAVDQETFLFARLAGLTVEDIDLLDLEDNNRLTRRFRQAYDDGADEPRDAA